MGRIITTVPISVRSSMAALDNFGLGQVQLFYRSGTFVVPDNITIVRARVFGGGGGGCATGATPYGSAGGTSSFGAYVSATGGAGGTNSAGPSIGGSGSSGDINNTGGNGFNGQYSGGGGVASLFGAGGAGTNSTNRNPSLGAGGGRSVSTRGGDSFLSVGGYDSSGTPPTISQPTGDWNFQTIDLLGTGAGGQGSTRPTNGGGGAGTSNQYAAVNGAWPGGGGGLYAASAYQPGAGGGFAIKTISGLTPGASIVVTVGAGGVAGDSTSGSGAPGLVVVEW